MTEPNPKSRPSPPPPDGPQAADPLAGLAARRSELATNLVTPNEPISFDEKTCTGCNACVDACPIDVFVPNPKQGGVPISLFVDECWYCGACEMRCPAREEGAIRMNFPLMQRVRWKRKDDGDHFRLGMRNPPPPNTRPPA